MLRFCVAILVLCLLSVSALADEDEFGRYQLGEAAGGIAVLLDTATGQTWILDQSSNAENSEWLPLGYSIEPPYKRDSWLPPDPGEIKPRF